MKEYLQLNSSQAAQRPSLTRTIEIYQDLESKRRDFEQLKPEEMTQEIIIYALQRNVSPALEWVPELLKTREICLLAVALNIENLLYVPEKFIDQAFIDSTVMLMTPKRHYFSHFDCKSIYQKIPTSLLTQWHFKKLIDADGVFLKWLPSEAIDYKLCYKALDSDGMLLKYVPTHLIDKSMCYKALAYDSNARAFVPDSLWDNHCERILSDRREINSYGLTDYM